MIILPSIASADQLALGEELARLQDWKYLHVDIEDGNFVPNITFGLKTVRKIAAAAREKRIDVHLLVTNPEEYLSPLAECGVQLVSAHIEALDYPLAFLNRARDLGLSPGLAMNFATPLSAVEPFLERLDYLLFMTAEPDARGEQFYPPMAAKVADAVKRFGMSARIQIDGGLNLEHLLEFAAIGIDEAVLGRAAFCTRNHHENLRNIQLELEKVTHS